jgi:uncharacterized membrane protein
MKACIYCQKSVEGKRAVKVREDAIIKTLRNLKRSLNMAKENELYVCEEDFKKHQERRKSFQTSLIIFSIAAVLVLLLAIVSMVISGNINLLGLVSAIIIGLFLVIFAVVFRYAPEVESQEMVLVGVSPAAAPIAKPKEEQPKAAAGRKKR